MTIEKAARAHHDSFDKRFAKEYARTPQTWERLGERIRENNITDMRAAIAALEPTEAQIEAGAREAGALVNPWQITTREINPKYQRTVCPFCGIHLVKFEGHLKKCEGLNNVIRAAYAAITQEMVKE